MKDRQVMSEQMPPLPGDPPRFFAEDAETYPSPYGDLMEYADHVEALRQAAADAVTMSLAASQQGQRDGYKKGYGAAMDDGWGEPGHIKAALDAAVQRFRALLDGPSDLVSRESMERAIKGES